MEYVLLHRTFKDMTAKTDAQELEDVRCDRGRTSEDHTHSSTEAVANLAKHQSIPERMHHRAILAQILLLGRVSFAEECRL
jgi:hypothetical protein